MRIRIYQINFERDTNHIVFTGLERLERVQGVSTPDSSIYDLVYDGTVGCENLEELFGMFNTDHPDGYTGRSLSVSDVVEIITDERSTFWFCDSIGFKEVPFETDKTVNRSKPQKPEWGIYPDGPMPRMFWGARGIITNGYLELLRDRQSFQAADDVSDSEKTAFMQWINVEAIPYMNRWIAKHETSLIELSSSDARYKIVAEDRDSGGYLYLGAYTI